MNLIFTEPGCSAGGAMCFIRRHPQLILILRASVFNMILLLSSLQLIASANGNAQGIAEIRVTIELKNESLADFFKKIETQTKLSFTFPDEIYKHTDISLPKATLTVKEALDMVLKGTKLAYKQVGENIVMIFLEGKKGGEKAGREDEASIQSETNTSTVTTVRGVVTDNIDNQPLPGVNVIVKGTTIGTNTDSEGRYSIDVDHNTVLIFSFIGFRTFEVPVGGRTSIDVSMETDVTELGEVVIQAGYYNVKEREKTGSISSVSASVIGNQPVTNPLQTMQGRVPGVYINQFSGLPGSNFQVRIRGTNSLTNGNNPLYVIDGIPFISETLSSNETSSILYGYQFEQGGQQVSGISPLNSINPDNIESIEILKDADATAIYGSRGANGVILITTKKGKAGTVNVDVNIKSGISKVLQRIDVLNTKQYIAMRMEAVQNDGEVAPKPYEVDINGTWDQNRYTDWQDVLIGGTAKMTDINTSISGGNNETQFLFSAGYNDQGTVFIGDNSAKRFSTHFSISHTTNNKKFNTRLSTSYIINSSNLMAQDLTKIAPVLAPNAPKLYDDNGQLNWENSTWFNPLAQLENRFNSNTYNLLMNVELGYEIVRGLRIKANLGLNDIRNNERMTLSSNSVMPVYQYTPASHSQLSTGTSITRSLIVEPQLNWETEVSKGKVSVLIGSTYQYRESELSQARFRGFPSNALINDPNSASFIESSDNTYAEYRYAALYGRLNYAWEGKYILNITGRRDGSSRFGPGKKFANLGAVGLAWIFSNEGFLKNNIPFLSFGKIRSSYGLTGNDQIGDYKYLDTYNVYTRYQGISSLRPSQLFNPDYGWEVNKKLEGAIELGFLNDRILLTAAWYRNRSSNQLIQYKLAGTSGYSSVLQNSPATVQNSGLEFEFNTVNVIKGYFKWATTLNITFPQNKLIAFPNLESSSYANTYVVGKPLNIQKVYHYLGVDPSSGLYQFEDVNEDGQFTPEDQISLIEYGQKYYGGFNNSLSFKGLQIEILFQFVRQTGKLFTAIGEGIYDRSGNGNQPSNVFEGRWKNPGDQATKQYFSRSEAVSSRSYQYNVSDAVAGEIYFIRLKNMSISYLIPGKLLRGIRSRVYLQGQNLVTITDYTGLDPETGTGVLPPLTTLVAGLQLTF